MPGGYIEVAKAAVTIVPTMEGAQQTITDELSGAGAAAGKTAGKATGGAMVTSLGSSMSKAGGTLTKRVTAPLKALGSASLDAFRSVDAGLDIIVTKTGASGEALEGMTQVFNGIAREIPTDFETIGSAIGEVNTRFGLTGSALHDLSTQFIQFAAINNQDVSTSVDRVANVLAAFGMEATEAGDLLDAFNVVGQNTGIDVGTLADLLSANAVQLRSLGMTAYDAAGFLGSVAVAGLDSSTAMRGLQTAMKYAAANGQSMDDVLSGFLVTMKSNASESDKLASAYEIFGTKAGAAIYNAVSQGTLDLANFSGSLEDFSGSVANTFEAAQDPIDGFQTVTNALALAGAQLVESAAPAITTAVDTVLPVITGLADAWGKLPSGMQSFIIYAGLASAAIGPILSTVGPLVSGLGGIVTKLTALGTVGGGASAVLQGVGSAAGGASGAVAGAASSFATMAGQALKLAAVAGSIWLAAQAVDNLADTAIKITTAGPEAEIAMGAMAAGIVVLMGAFAALGPALDAGALGIVAFGAALLGIGEGVNLATQGISKLVNSVGNTSLKFAEAAKIVADAGFFESIGAAAIDAGTGFQALSDAVIRLVKETGAVDLAVTLSKTATGIRDVTKYAKDSKDAVDPLDKTTAALGRFTDALGFDLEYAISDASDSLATLQDLFDGTILQLPEVYIPTPHFNVFSGAAPYGINGLGAVPYITVQWYAQAAKEGAVFDSPQIIGVGDASEPEFLLGRSALRDQLADMVQSGGSSPVVDAIAAMAAEVVAAINDKDTEISIDGQALARILSRYQRQNARAYG